MGKVDLNPLITHFTTPGRAVRADGNTAFALMEVNSSERAAHTVKSYKDRGNTGISRALSPAFMRLKSNLLYQDKPLEMHHLVFKGGGYRCVQTKTVQKQTKKTTSHDIFGPMSCILKEKGT